MKWHRNMEDERIRMGTNHKKKNKNRNKSDGGGGGGNIVGLALAVVGFIAVVSLSLINKNRKKGSESNPKPKPQKASLDKKCKSHEDHEIETKQGLDALVQPSCSITTTKGDSAPCNVTTDTKSINHTLIQEEKIGIVPNINTITEVVSTISFQEEIVLSDDSNSESAASSHDSRIDEECLASLGAEKVEDNVVSDIVEEKYCSSETILNGAEIGIRNEEHVEAETETEVTNDGVNVKPEITSDEKGKSSMEVNDQHQPISVSDSFQLTTLLMLLPGLILLLVLLLLMYLTQKVSFLQ